MRRALFLDRDGIINEDFGYVWRPEEVVFVDGIFDLCRAAQPDYVIIVVTNQAGVARGYYGEEEVQALHAWMKTEFAKRGVRLEAFYYCPYHPEGTVKSYCKTSFDRKPAPGMLLKAQEQYSIHMQESIMIGDKASDMEAAYDAGVGSRILITADSHASGRHTRAFTDLRNAARSLFPLQELKG